jgi:predicted nucleotidyltransferase
MNRHDDIVNIIRDHVPGITAIYLFGSYGTTEEWTNSDVDLALLSSPQESSKHQPLLLTPCHYALMKATRRAVDIIDIRAVSTVFQMEIIRTGRLIYCADSAEVLEFESRTLSQYQKLNEERLLIIESFQKTGRAYAV